MGSQRSVLSWAAPLALAAGLLCSCISTPYRQALSAGDDALHQGRYQEARRQYDEAAKRAAAAKLPLELARARHSAAAAALLLGRLSDAEADYRGALDALQAAQGPAEDRAATLGDLANVLALQGRPIDAVAAYRRSAAEYAKAPAAGALERAGVLASLGQLELAQRHYAEAEQAYSEAISLREKALGGSHGSLAPLLEDLAAALTGQQKVREAELAQRRARALEGR